jgi:hypothetical protein
MEITKFEEDEAMIRWCALALIDGRKESDIRREVSDMMLNDSHLSRQGWLDLMSSARLMAGELRSFIMSRAEMNSVDYLRLDSYTRRKRMMDKLEHIIADAMSQSDSVSKLNSTSFMIGGLLKAQNDMDAFTGAKEAKPAVVVNIGYDPLNQFREVIQSESTKAKIVFEVEPTLAISLDEEE